MSPPIEGAPEWATAAAMEGRTFLSYFQNQYGEHWVAAVVDGKFLLSGSDLNWHEEAYEDLDNFWYTGDLPVGVSTSRGFVFNLSERYWLDGIHPTARILMRQYRDRS